MVLCLHGAQQASGRSQGRLCPAGEVERSAKKEYYVPALPVEYDALLSEYYGSFRITYSGRDVYCRDRFLLSGPGNTGLRKREISGL